MLQRLGIGAVLNCAPSVCADPVAKYNKARILYAEIDAQDDRSFQLIKECLKPASEFISAAHRDRGCGVLVHCMAGINRSAALAIGYLLVRDRPNLFTLFSACVSSRPSILQNPSFQLQLCELANMHGLMYDPSAPPPPSLPLLAEAEARAAGETSSAPQPRLPSSLLQWAREGKQTHVGGMVSEVAPRLLVGNRRFAADRELLRRHNVVAVVCVGAKPQFEGESGLRYHHVSISDDGTQSMYPFFEAATEFISEALGRKTQNQEAVLVHCQGGMSRSPAMAMAYLIRREGLTLAEAAEMVYAARPAVKPRPTFLRDLEELQASMGDKGGRQAKGSDSDGAAGEKVEEQGASTVGRKGKMASEGKGEASDEGDGGDTEQAEGPGTQRERLLGNVVATANSHIHNLIWNEAGELWAFGCGSGGRCGVGYYFIGANAAKPRKSRMKAYMSAPNRVGAVWPPTPEVAAAMEAASLRPVLEGKRVVSACASRYHGCALVLDA
mmetsp:Transcript_23110/g.41341  ORF Transcript_23110/g.41341 Transcript_23110/m.41341 type:complete len:498 (-) Transcript_23110:95-1588(-)